MYAKLKRCTGDSLNYQSGPPFSTKIAKMMSIVWLIVQLNITKHSGTKLVTILI